MPIASKTPTTAIAVINIIRGRTDKIASPIRFGIQSHIGRPLRLTFVAEGGGNIERSAGIKVISITSVLMIPIPVKIPNERIVGILKVNREKNPAAAIPPANIITGPTRTRD